MQIPDVDIRSDALEAANTGSDFDSMAKTIQTTANEAYHGQCDRVVKCEGKSLQLNEHSRSVNQSDARETKDTVNSDSDHFIHHGDRRCNRESANVGGEAGHEHFGESFDIHDNNAYGMELQSIEIREYENVLQDI